MNIVYVFFFLINKVGGDVSFFLKGRLSCKALGMCHYWYFSMYIIFGNNVKRCKCISDRLSLSSWLIASVMRHKCVW